MKVALVLLFVTAALAAPQDFNNEDAEFVPRGTGPDDAQDGNGFVVVVPRFNFNPFTNFFRRVFSSDPSVSEDGAPGTFDTPDSDQPRRPGGIFSFIDSIFRQFPSPSDNATETFRNSTIEVINIGGVPMQVNRTIVEHTHEDGSVYRRIDQRLIGPLANYTTTALPAVEDDVNELEPEVSA